MKTTSMKNYKFKKEIPKCNMGAWKEIIILSISISMASSLGHYELCEAGLIKHLSPANLMMH